MYTIGEFSRLINVSVKSLQRWDREGRLVPIRTPSNRRMYSQKQLETLIGERIGKRKTVLYCRVSSPSQRSDLLNQVKAMKTFANVSGYGVDEIVEEIGGGMNMKRNKLRKLISEVRQGKVETVVIGHKDRLTRFGFDLIEYMFELNGTNIVIANNETLFPQEEMVSDLMSIIDTFSCRLYGLRRYKDEIKDAISAQDSPDSE